MEYPYTVVLSSDVAELAKTIAEKLTATRRKQFELHEQSEQLHTELWELLDTDDQIDIEKNAYNYDGESHTVECTGLLEDENEAPDFEKLFATLQ